MRTRDKLNIFLNLYTIRDFAILMNIDLKELVNWCKNPIYKTQILPKKTGGARFLHVPDSFWMNNFKKLNMLLQNIYLKVKPIGSTLTIFENAKTHSNKAHILNVDIKNFYHSVKATHVRDIFLKHPFNVTNEIAITIALMCTYEGRLPMGVPTSSILANFAFMDIDLSLALFAKKHNFEYSRYVDDLTFSSNQFISQKIVYEIKEILKPFGFILNDKKTRFLSNNTRQIVTGLVVNEKPNITKTYIRNIRATFYNINTYGMTYAIKRYNHFFPAKKIVPVHNTFFESKMCLSQITIQFLLILRGKIDFVGQIRGKNDLIYNKFLKQLEDILNNHNV